jgi:triphosphoribosyl-dephospho-CoA synthase
MTASLALKRHAIDVPAIAARALLQELDLTPKPGLVDQAN